MALTRKQKTAVLEQLKEALSSSEAVFAIGYRGLTVQQMTQLRRGLRESGATLQVVKNTLARIALKETGLPDLDDLLVGPVALVFCPENSPAAAKALVDFGKDLEKETTEFALKGGLLEGKRIDAATISSLAELPPRDVMLAQVLGMLQAPMAQVVGLFNNVMAQTISVLQARGDQLGGQAEAA